MSWGDRGSWIQNHPGRALLEAREEIHLHPELQLCSSRCRATQIMFWSEWFRPKHICVLTWCPPNLDSNPFENLWQDLKFLFSGTLTIWSHLMTFGKDISAKTPGGEKLVSEYRCILHFLRVLFETKKYIYFFYMSLNSCVLLCFGLFKKSKWNTK